MATPIAPHEARLAIGAVTLSFEKFDVDVVADDIAVRTFESSVTLSGVTRAFETRIAGFVSATVSGSGYWDADTPPHTNPPFIQAASTLTNVYGYTRRTGTRRFVFPSLLILNVKVGADVTAAKPVQISFSGKNNGYFTYPA